MHAALAGGLAGLAATVPMTAVMVAGNTVLPPQQRELPPHQITMELAARAGVADELDREERLSASALGHFAYGVLAGAGYGALARGLGRAGLLTGVAFGGLVWAGSYLGWLPALRVRPPATREPAGRTATMVAAHLVWGATLGWLVERWGGARRR